MRVFNSQPKNVAYFLYRIVSPIIDPLRLIVGFYGYGWFIRDLLLYKLKDKKAQLLNINLFPKLDEKTSFTKFDSQYFYQQLWAFEQILKRKVGLHIDVGSSYIFNGYVSKITKVIFIDLRPIQAPVVHMESKRGDIVKIPLPSNSVKSLSSLCVAGHVGLGRYGDLIDPRGMEKACAELTRVLARGGYLYFSTSTGGDRICFNAHRVSSPLTVLKYFTGLKLVSFSVVDDHGKFHEDVDYKDFLDMHYGAGLYAFTKE